MSRQITINRDSIGLEPLILHNPQKGFYLSDEFSPSSISWQRYEASTSPFVNGERIIAQRKTNDETIFRLHLDVNGLKSEAILKSKNEIYQERFIELHQALSQKRFDYTVEWEGIVEVYNAAGAADIEKVLDPVLTRAGWVSFVISIPTSPFLTNTGE